MSFLSCPKENKEIVVNRNTLLLNKDAGEFNKEKI